MKRIILVFTSLCILVFSGCTLPSINLTGYEIYPEECFADFIDCLNSGRYDEASEYLSNYSSLGFEEFPEGSVHAALLGSLNASRSVTVLGSSSVRGRNAAMSVEITTIDFRKLEESLEAASLEAVDQYQFETGVLPDNAKIEELMAQTLEAMLTEPLPYYTTEEFRLNFRYEDDIWKLECTSEFYSALIGYIV